MEDYVISVGPAGSGWLLDCDFNGQALMFSSGAKAEENAYALARRIAAAGRTVLVQVRARNGDLAGSRRYGASEIPPVARPLRVA